MTMSAWFWSSALGPGPSVGTGDIGSKGLATPATRKLKKPPMANRVPSAQAECSGSRSRTFHAKIAVDVESTSPQSRMLPSRLLHSDTMVTQVGVVVLPTLAT